jgi:hypothetical protein
MAQMQNTKAPSMAKYTVLRAIFMDGERVEVGSTVEMTPVQYTEAAAAGKVGPLQVFVADSAEAAAAEAAAAEAAAAEAAAAEAAAAEAAAAEAAAAEAAAKPKSKKEEAAK